MPRIIRLPEVTRRTSLSRSTVFRLIQQKRFPASIALTARCRGWFESEVEQWLAERPTTASQGGRA